MPDPLEKAFICIQSIHSFIHSHRRRREKRQEEEDDDDVDVKEENITGFGVINSERLLCFALVRRESLDGSSLATSSDMSTLLDE